MRAFFKGKTKRADVFNAIFSTGPAVALIITLILDNTVPGTREERGLHVWQQLDMKDQDWWDDDYANRVSYPDISRNDYSQGLAIPQCTMEILAGARQDAHNHA